MKIVTTTGSSFDMTKPARSNLIMKIVNNNGAMAMQTLKILGIAGYHEEFMEQKADILIEDEFGCRAEIPEDFIWQ